jgi:glutamate-1-semialdehyde 2,1-aminomutase
LKTADEITSAELVRLDELIEAQERQFVGRQPRSTETIERAARSLAGGVTSSWQIARPQTVWISHGAGSKIYDLDGNEYVDLHGGYGVMLVGHAHPAIVGAVSERIRLGTHFAQPTPDSIVVAEELARRFGLPLWRFCNSGTEATMDGVHLMRAATGRDLILKVEGTYHGHHDSVQVSVYPEPEDIGPADRPASVPGSTGIPDEIVQLTRIVPYNDLEVLERTLDENAGHIAGLIMEPIMMNAGIIGPEPGYLEGVRELTRARGLLLAFDEVKTGLTVAPGGATEYFGVTPDIVCLAKSLGGGIPCGAIGGTAEVMETIVTGEYDQVGTFNGNPLTMAAARAVLTQILDDDVYSAIAELQTVMVEGCNEIISRWRLPAHVVSFGAKGCIVFSDHPVRSYRDFLTVDDRFSHCHWLFQHNNGVFLPPWGKSEQWLVSVQHDRDDAQRFLSNFEMFADALRS